MKDHYKVLGVPRTATGEQIKQSYRYLVKGCHPDVNSSPKAAEWTRELNASYNILGDAQARLTYDSALRSEESKQSQAYTQTRSYPNQTPPRQPRAETKTRSQPPRTETRTPPKAQPIYGCGKCSLLDASIRVSVFWRVSSFISFSKCTLTEKVLCQSCRVKESLAASGVTLFFGWWSVRGFLWTLEALFHNARGGRQSRDGNATLLTILGHEFCRTGRHQEAYKAFFAAACLKPDPNLNEPLASLKRFGIHNDGKGFQARFCALELHPFWYHGLIGAGLIFVFWLGFGALNANPPSGMSGAATPAPVAYDPRPWESAPSVRPVALVTMPRSHLLVFSEPERALPAQGALELSETTSTYQGLRATLMITTRPSEGNYVMKIQDWNTGAFIGEFFINQGDTFSVDLPLGSYKLKFATGNKWYGTKYLFGPSTRYSYAADEMVLSLVENRLKGIHLTLIPSLGGTLVTPPLKPEDW